MAQNQTNGRYYLAAILGKAWEEVSIIEVLSEAIGGFMLAGFAHYKGWIDQDGVFEMLLDYIGCAILIPLVAFVLRVLFAAPAELVRESAENRKKCEINPKSIYPAIIAILLAISSFLSICLIFSLKFNFANSGGKPNLHHIAIKEPPKRLPDKIIPAPEAPPPMYSTQQVASIEPPKQFETNNPNTGDIGDVQSEIAKLKAEKKAEIEAENQRMKLNAQTEWKTNLAIFNVSIEALHDVLSTEAAKRGDGIAKTVGYFQCLPQTIDFEVSETNVAEIRFQTETNLAFQIAITRMNMNQRRSLKMFCDCGSLIISPTRDRRFLVNVQIPDYSDTKFMPTDKPRDFIDKYIKILVGGQIDYLNRTKNNNGVTKTVDRPQ